MVLRWKSGDELAFEQFYNRNFERLLRVAYKKVRVFPIAEEITQDAFLGFYNRKDALNEEPVGYLMGILRHKVLDYFRRHGKDAGIFLDMGQGNIPEPATDDFLGDIVAKETDLRLRRNIGRLPEKCREVFLLSRQQNLTNREIAERLNISIKTVEMHIGKALKYLRQHLDYHLFWYLLLVPISQI